MSRALRIKSSGTKHSRPANHSVQWSSQLVRHGGQKLVLQTIRPFRLSARGALTLEKIGTLLFGSFSLGKLPNLAPNRIHHAEQLLVGVFDFPTEELENSQHLSLHQNRQAKAGMQSHPCCYRRPGKVGITSDVVDADGRAGFPNSSRQTNAFLQRHSARELLKLIHFDSRRLAKIDTAHAVVAINHPERANVPIEMFARRPHDLLRRFDEVCALSQNPRHGIL